MDKFNVNYSHLVILVELLEGQLQAGNRLLNQSLTDDYVSTQYLKGYVHATEEALRAAKNALKYAEK
jgi:hypothetical protein